MLWDDKRANSERAGGLISKNEQFFAISFMDAKNSDFRNGVGLLTRN